MFSIFFKLKKSIGKKVREYKGMKRKQTNKNSLVFRIVVNGDVLFIVSYHKIVLKSCPWEYTKCGNSKPENVFGPKTLVILQIENCHRKLVIFVTSM